MSRCASTEGKKGKRRRREHTPAAASAASTSAAPAAPALVDVWSFLLPGLLSGVTVKTVGRAAAVCRSWRETAESEELWLLLQVRDHGPAVASPAESRARETYIERAQTLVGQTLRKTRARYEQQAAALSDLSDGIDQTGADIRKLEPAVLGAESSGQWSRVFYQVKGLKLQLY